MPRALRLLRVQESLFKKQKAKSFIAICLAFIVMGTCDQWKFAAEGVFQRPLCIKPCSTLYNGVNILCAMSLRYYSK
jgi:hypothetical protein